MADTKISNFPDATSLIGDEIVPILQGGINKKVVVSEFSDKYYAHDQSVASAAWAITHNLNKYPAVTITDSAGDQVEGEVHYDSLNALTVKFSAPFSGKTYLN